MKTVVIIVFFLTAVVSIYPIIFKNALEKNKIDLKFKTLKTELSKVNSLSLSLIILIVALNISSGFISYKNIDESDKKQKVIESQNENVFTRMQNEIKFNLQNMYIHYRKEIVVKAAESNQCMTTRLSNTYIKEYESISNNKFLIKYLMEASDRIDNLNVFSNELCKPKSLTARIPEIDMFLHNTEYTQEYLYPFFNRILKASSYKEFEAFDFSISIPIDLKAINRHLLDDFEERPPIKSRIKKLPNGGIKLLNKP